MDIQRIRNLTTGRLHTKMSDIYEDIEYITGIKGYMTHHLPRAVDCMLPYLKKFAPDVNLWEDEYNPNHQGTIEIPPMDDKSKREFLDAFIED